MQKRLKYLFLIIFIGVLFKYLWVLDPVLAFSYDLLTQQDNVEEFSLSNYELVKFADLPERERAKYEIRTCKSFKYKDSKFIKIEWFDRYRNLIGEEKGYKFLTPDRLIKNRIRIPNLAKTQYLLIDKEVINVYQKLINELQIKELDVNEIRITSGFRNPSYNKAVSGATCSQHQMGTAIDILVGDLNRDGLADKLDRKFIFDILELKLIKNNGGLGKYKNSPTLIHFDTRGHRARW